MCLLLEVSGKRKTEIIWGADRTSIPPKNFMI